MQTLLLLSFVLTVWSIIVGAGTQLLLNKSKYPLIRDVFRIPQVEEPTASKTMIVAYYFIIWVVIHLFLEYSVISYPDMKDIVRVPATVLIIDFANYFFHRTFHHPRLYGKFHGMHHSNRNPASWEDSALTDLLDWILSSLIYISPPLILGATPAVLLTITWVTLQVQFNHSGYLLPKVPLIISSLEHQGHHWYYNYNYSELTTIPDTIFGTYLSHQQIIERRKRKNGEEKRDD